MPLTLPKPKQYQVLTSAWKPARLSAEQARYLGSAARTNYVAAGRRSYKTQALKQRIVRAAIAPQEFDDAQYFACGPTHQQTQDIFWEDIKRLIPDWAFKRDRKRSVSESTHRIDLWNHACIRCAGLDVPARIEGGFWDGGGITEYASIKPGILQANINPMRIRGGWIDCEGVPEGKNHFFNEVKYAQKRAAMGDDSYAYHHWKTADVLWLWLGVERAEEEIAMAMDSMDILTYRQEYEASFNNFTGQVYYGFSSETHAKEKLEYDPRLPLVVCMDFNVSPGTATYLQEQQYDGTDEEVAGRFTAVLGEVYIPRDSNTPMVCRRILADWKKIDGRKPRFADHQGDILIYGDPAGGAKSTKSERGSDWDRVREHLLPHFGEKLKMRVKREQPRQRVRVNALNSRILTANGTKKLLVDPVRCPRTVEDFEYTTVKEGTDGEIDKDKDDGKYSHLTDGISYYCDYTYSIASISSQGSM